MKGLGMKGSRDAVLGAFSGTGGPVPLHSKNKRIDCQHRADTKAFMGKGTLDTLRKAMAHVDSVRAQMRSLVDESFEIPGKTMYLCLHKRSKTEQMSVRWRRIGERARHLAWEEVAELLATYDRGIAEPYRSLDARAKALNAAEMEARKALRVALDAVEARQLPLEPVVSNLKKA